MRTPRTRRASIRHALAALASAAFIVSPAAAQQRTAAPSATSVVTEYSSGNVRVRAPGASTWETVRATSLPTDVPVMERNGYSWVLVDVPGRGQTQMHFGDVKLRNDCWLAQGPGRTDRAAGSQGAGGGRVECPRAR